MKKQASKASLWQFLIDKGKGEEEVGRKWCIKPSRTKIWKMLQQDSNVKSYGYRIVENQ